MQATGSMGRSDVTDVYPVIRSNGTGGGTVSEGNPATASSEMDEDMKAVSECCGTEPVEAIYNRETLQRVASGIWVAL